MKRLENYLYCEGYDIFGYKPGKQIMGFKYVKEKIHFAIIVKKKSGLYTMNFTDYRYDPDGELEYMVSPYLKDITDFLKEYKGKRFQKLCNELNTK